MSRVARVHEEHGATFIKRGGERVVAHYGRAERVHRAVRNVVGVTEDAAGIIVVDGDDRVAFVDDAVSNRVPTEDGQGVYALLLDPQGHVEADLYVFNAGERLLVFTPPGRAGPLAAEWQEKTFVQDVEIRDATEEFATFGVHGPKATEKIASVFSEQTPDEPLTFVRGVMDRVGVTVIRTDGLTGEAGYEVICAADEAADVFDTLENRGLNAAPFGWRTWESLTLEAGTPLFETELSGRLPNDLGVRNAVDFEKGCFIGQEVVSRIENRGRPSQRLVGLTTDTVVDAGTPVVLGENSVGQITRAAHSPTREQAIALALVDYEAEGDFSVRGDGEVSDTEQVTLPFVEGSARSARLPTY